MRFAFLENFGHSLGATCFLAQPENTEQIAALFDLARQRGMKITARGAGRSYNDAALNGGGLVLDLRRMNRILEWNAEQGLLRAEPGVTLEQVWQCVLPDGWWPPVVSGTMRTTLGGCLAANIHGKNNYQAGVIGEHVLEFRALLPGGEEVTCSPQQNADLFYAMIGGLGMLGIFTEITLQMKRVHSGLLEVQAWPVKELNAHLDSLEAQAPAFDYIVGWLDGTAGGKALGRGQIHAARYLLAGEDPNPQRTLSLEYQQLPKNILGIIPKAWMPWLMRPFMQNWSVALVNSGKYLLGKRRQRYLQSHAAFHFLLDYIPEWEKAYGQNGLIQYQSFLPKETAREIWREILQQLQKRGFPPYLGVTKRHRPDAFLLSHAVDGFSLALDFKVPSRDRQELRQLLQEFDKIIVEAGGRFYFAKNSETSAEIVRRFLGEETLQRFRVLKERCDPEHLLESDLYRRIFADRGK
uniref:FAD dependent oxidoreductase n=1 Tax=uncultured Chloroflexota bacterium TaxID=166587 RepID=H5SER6_9CHLR|nr:FAD dependent oxidoreductase [uncultured Chloroflexota bacterium]